MKTWTAARSRGPRSVAAFAAVAAALIALLGAALTLGFRSPADIRALAISAALAWLVQTVSYALARYAVSRPKRPIFTAWVVGMILRFGAVVVYALVGTRAWSLPPLPALLSFVIFLFVSTLLEPWLLYS
jgi:hypothetical protein